MAVHSPHVRYRGTTSNRHLGILWVHGDCESSTEFELNQILGLGLALLLFGSGIWATVSGGSLSQNKDAWVSHVGR